MFWSFSLPSLNLPFGQTKVHSFLRKVPGRAAATAWLESTTCLTLFWTIFVLEPWHESWVL